MRGCGGSILTRILMGNIKVLKELEHKNIDSKVSSDI
jgi:hypothetical protein